MILSCVSAFAWQPTTVLTKIEKSGTSFTHIPVIDGANNEALEANANSILNAVAADLRKRVGRDGLVDYKVTLNRPSLVSILLSGANSKGEKFFKPVNIDLTSGKEFSLNDFLQDGMARREVMDDDFTDILFGEDGVFTAKKKYDMPNTFTTYEKLIPLMRIGEVGRLIPIHRITDKVEGKVLNLKKGDMFAIQLKSNPTTGYRWSAQIPGGDNIPEGEKGILLVGSSFMIPKDTPRGMTGVGGYEILFFAAREVGTYDMKMVYGRPWEGNAAASSLNFTVDITNN